LRPVSYEGIQAVTFDVGGTLINPWPSVGHIYAEVAEEFGIEAIPDFINLGFKEAWKSRHNFDYSQEGWFDIVRESFREQGSILPEEFFPEVYQRFARAEVWIVFGDVLRTLDELADCDLKLAVISNWDDRLIPLLEELGLRSRFEQIFVSCNVGFNKPSPIIFEQAIRWLKVEPHQVLHVGDSQLEDFEGATSCGMQSTIVARGRRTTELHQITTLADLPKLIR
jgi:putative hydrolase of the HAD superfamily